MQGKQARRHLFTALKNEGPFILEWVAYHKALGFSDITMVSNDCDDGSDDILSALAAVGEITHLIQTVPPGTAPQISAEAHARAAGVFREGDWTIWLDMDEFLVCRSLAGVINAVVRAGADAIALNWSIMGDGGQNGLPARLVSKTFTGSAKRSFVANRSVKTLFRNDARVTALHLHRPIWSVAEPPVRVIDGRGEFLVEPFAYRFLENGSPMARIPLERGVYRLGQINHYSVRTPEVFRLKKLRGRGAARHDGGLIRHDASLYDRMNRNERSDTAILRHAETTDKELARLSALPGVLEAHEAACAVTRRRLASGRQQMRAERGDLSEARPTQA